MQYHYLIAGLDEIQLEQSSKLPYDKLLELFQEHGKGQFIFTSHNLRPLEVLDKKFICFTTANPSNRYIRMKGVGHSNNLRSLYFRNIIMADKQDEVLYKNEKKYKILGAFKHCLASCEETDG